MFGHDARHTGRTTVTPAAPEQRGTFKWIYDPDDTHPNNPDEVDAIHGGVAIGPDGKLFFGTTSGRFICVSRTNGQRLWSYPPSNQPPACDEGAGVFCTPALGVAYSPRDGESDWPPGQQLYNVYFTTTDGRLWCFRPDGTLSWMRSMGDGIGGSPVIGSNGRIYVAWSDEAIRRSYVSAYDAAGSLKWTQQLPPDGTNRVGVIAGPALGADGTIYVGDSRGRLHAVLDLDSEPRLKWPGPYFNENGTLTIHCEPVIGDDGTIYFTTFYQGARNGLHAVTDHGQDAEPTAKWDGLQYDFLWKVVGPGGPPGEDVGQIEGGPFLNWSAEGSQIWFGTYIGNPSRFIRVQERAQGEVRWAEGVVVTPEALVNNVDAVGACARWWDDEKRLQQAIIIAYEEPFVYSFKPEARFDDVQYWWRLGPPNGSDPTFPETIERPHISIDSDGTVYVGTSSPRYESGRLFAIWGP